MPCYIKIHLNIMVVACAHIYFFSIVSSMFFITNVLIIYQCPVTSAPCQSLQSRVACGVAGNGHFRLRSIRTRTKDTAGISDKGIKVMFTPVCFQHPGKDCQSALSVDAWLTTSGGACAVTVALRQRLSQETLPDAFVMWSI